jgi:hypothetical protein
MNTFACVYYGNTGSSWLMHTLRNAPGVWIPAFEPLERHHWKTTDADKAAWLTNALTPPPTGEREAAAWQRALEASPQVDKDPPEKWDAVGLKLTMDAVHDWSVLRSVFLDHRSKLFFLRRRNRLKHALSLYRHHEEEKNQFQFRGVLAATELNLKVFEKWLGVSQRVHDESLAEEATWGEMAGSDRTLAIDYEDFIDEEGKNRTVKQVCGFLGLDCNNMSFSSYYKKATSDRLAEAVVNYRDLVDRYITTDLADFLYD